MFKKILQIAAFLLPNLALAHSPYSNGEVCHQTSNQYEVKKETFCNNWLISVGGGEQLLASENDKIFEIGEHIIPVHDTAVNKWLSPGIGIRAIYSGLSLQGTCNKDSSCLYSHNLNKFQSVSEQMNLHADILFNASNLIFGYSEQRIWDVIPYTNYALYKALDRFSDTENGYGIYPLKEFHGHQTVNINLNIHGIFVGNHFNTENNPPKDGIFSATLGLTYSLPNQKKENIKIPIYNDDLWSKYSKQLKCTLKDSLHLTQLLFDTEDRVIIEK